MFWIIVIALAIVALVAVSIIGFAVHLLLSPWLLLAIAIVAFIKFRPRGSRR